MRDPPNDFPNPPNDFPNAVDAESASTRSHGHVATSYTIGMGEQPFHMPV